MEDDRMKVSRMIFMIHPFCYASPLNDAGTGIGPQWNAYHLKEASLSGRWYDTVDSMKDTEALIYNPGSGSVEEKELAGHCRRKLGRRFIELSGRDIAAPEGAAPETMAALAQDICEAFRARGKYKWYAHDLRVAVFSYNYAHDIIDIFNERDLYYDPEDISMMAFGESFEGCVLNWTTMVPDYLGINKRVVIPFELSLPDSMMLLGCRHIDRIELPYDTALHLVEDGEGRPAAFYVRERVRLSDVSYYASLPFKNEDIRITIKDGTEVFSRGRRIGGAIPADFIRTGSDGTTQVMIASGRWRGGGHVSFTGRESHLFITAENFGREEFFRAVREAAILPE